MSNVQSMKYYIIILIVFLFSCKKDVVSPINITENTTITPPKDSTFLGYKVDTLLLKTMGAGYWKNTGVPLDVIVQSFQKPYGNRTTYGTFFGSLIAGDFNGDGWIDVFNAGASWQGVQATFTFLIWNPLTKIFEEKNLFNNKSFNSFGGNHGNSIPVYLNNDNIIDLVLFDNGDEGISNSPNEPIRIVLSDGKGGYDLKEIKTQEDEVPVWRKEGGDVGDLNGDGLPDLVITCNMFVYIYWGVKDFPYFTTNKHATFVGDVDNFGYKSNNGFDEKVSNVAGQSYNAIITDFNKDGKNDIIFCVGENNQINQRILINQGYGRFNSNGLILLPKFPDANSTINQDYIVDDLNGDGLNDFIALRTIGDYQSYGISIYTQNKNGGYSVDSVSGINRVQKHLSRLTYFDYNKDGKKDIGYIDGADNGQVKYKSVFIRTGDKYIEEKLSKYDSYAGGLINKM